MASYSDVLQQAQNDAEIYGVEHASVEWLFFELLDWRRNDFIMKKDAAMPENEQTEFKRGMQRLLQGEPVQYILGYQYFYGERFKVNPSCLIPRPETEEVMLHFVKQLRPHARVVDIGTGSGNLPIMIKHLAPSTEVFATDISTEALQVARANAAEHEVDIEFLEGNTLEPLIEQGIKVDGLISNPPYISEDELEVMGESVRRYEPQLALFAEERGLAIYHKILKELPQVLNPEAVVTFEIGYLQGERITQLIHALYPWLNVEVVQDINGNERIASFVWTSES
ncbi:peptide chain release factor N(5)-glutamine methyltransferase [Staphylococcus pettenkoferi]|uniref:peptide chain release factor N(5)-glutamine methyltransferase n=1 Tax=Staphylococcus pettenkoferi TaxID=170573 RepID=UPI00066DB742|nr:peptide chain release factor N(5)-glutamine methyltransferase [Staphylococcus pettenkoferi]MCI2803811.1 peptide chain release factor N(5)-glutamine methyltransferase [Staphylococcus pettenkoferi]MCY1574807.1 peptide chain release factor N(5)-glutamine methyltransferase [Staphylococcus pettenkoferi]MCY1578801.1 peptide chain release factor N(5)-glutamine methyltransferase [Staphylococcus pettenkoferi]MCY1586628.1 peptide chain release factor N(5)-glutamine methyltransferase [Staphylococcus pe